MAIRVSFAASTGISDDNLCCKLSRVRPESVSVSRSQFMKAERCSEDKILRKQENSESERQSLLNWVIVWALIHLPQHCEFFCTFPTYFFHKMGFFVALHHVEEMKVSEIGDFTMCKEPKCQMAKYVNSNLNVAVHMKPSN